MGQQIIFFEKNKIDFSRENQVITASEGQDFVNAAVNRNNNTAWVTSGSTDASGTTYEIDMVDPHVIDSILLLKHNFKDYDVKFFDGASFVDFSTPIAVTGNTEESRSHFFNSVETTKIRLTIDATIIADADKFLFQFLATLKIGQLEGWPQVKRIRASRNKKSSKALSGKFDIRNNEDSLQFQLSVEQWRIAEDLELVENLHFRNESFHTWINAGDSTQFFKTLRGYRPEDIPLMMPSTEFAPEFAKKGSYFLGFNIKFNLVEVID